MWRFTESPLIDGEKVVVTPGGQDAMLVALDKLTGKTIWKSQMPASTPAGPGNVAAAPGGPGRGPGGPGNTGRGPGGPSRPGAVRLRRSPEQRTRACSRASIMG